MNALILDVHLKGSLSVIRSLGRRGISVAAAAKRRSACGLHSRFVSKRFIYRSPKGLDVFYHDVERILDELASRPVVYAFSDATVLALARNEEIMSRVEMLLPAGKDREIGFSKKETLARAQELGIPIPSMIAYRDGADLRDAVRDEKCPLVIKPQHSFVWVHGRGVRGDVSIAGSRDELVDEVERVYKQTTEWPLVQEYIEGEECGVEFLYVDGEAVLECAHKRIRSLSPTGGASVVKETISIPEDIGEMSRELLDSLSWHGPAMVEWKRDKDGNPYLMEINGRFWGSLPVAVAAGLDIPYAYYRAASGEKVERSVCMSGVRTQHILGDIAHVLGVMGKKGYVEGKLYPNLAPTLKAFLSDLFSTQHDVWSLSDPLPAIWEIIDYGGKLLRKS
ncbi:MAG: ATP-grasp domain-containing protein [Candidatus Paceibacterota bacterium]